MFQTTNERVRSQRNNDPLAHVYLLWDSYDTALAEHRMHTEFVTDMGERLKDQPFRSLYQYTYTAHEITYDTGLRYIASLDQSYQAAMADVAKGSFSSYHIERQKAFKQQGDVILNWLHTEEASQHLLLASLCPAEDELSFDEAKKQSFNPTRMMASLQLHTKNGDGSATTIAFSLDGLHIERFHELLQNLGIQDDIATTTLQQVYRPIYIDSNSLPDDVVSAIISTYDEQLAKETGDAYTQGVSLSDNVVEANSFVASHPDAFVLYKTIVEHVAESLHSGIVTDGLASTVRKELVSQYEDTKNIPHVLLVNSGEALSTARAGELIDYLRKRAIPEYLTSKLITPNRSSYATFGDIGSAGVSATQSGRIYDGACPSSDILGTGQQSVQEQAIQLGLRSIVSYETPKELFTKGDFAVIPIGSCPVCGAECGVGIKNVKSGKWYCTQSSCRAYKDDIYNFVFSRGNVDEQKPRNFATAEASRQKNENGRVDMSVKIKQTQATIWQIQHALLNETLEDSERQELVRLLIVSSLEQKQLLLYAVGAIAYDKLSVAA